MRCEIEEEEEEEEEELRWIVLYEHILGEETEREITYTKDSFHLLPISLILCLI